MKELKASAGVVVLQGGPRDKWAYTAADIEQAARAQAHLGKKFDYEPTGQIIDHSYSPGKTATQLVHVPAEIWRYIGKG